MSDRRSKILEAAHRLFHQYGPHKTTIGDIAQAAGIGVGSVYLEFPNKDELLLALSKAGHASVLEATRRAWKRRGTHERRLRRALEARVAAFRALAEGGLHGPDLLHCGGCTPIQQAHREFCDAEHELFGTFLTEGVRAGAFASGNVREATHGLLLAYGSFGPPKVFAYGEQEIERGMACVHALVFLGLRPR